MKLYHKPERIFNELKTLNTDEKLKVQDLSSFDQYHYLGTAAVDEAIDNLGISGEHRILDVGSGIGGPARYIAEKTGCQVTALELQSDLHEVAQRLTYKCGLSDRVKHVHGNILSYPEEDKYDFLVSWLAFLHIPERDLLMEKCFTLLGPHGKMYVEDFYKLEEFSAEELEVLDRDISCEYLPSLDDYKKQIFNAGFTSIELTDKTDSWKRFVEERKDSYIKNHAANIEKNDETIVEELEDFYTKMAWLFKGGNLGGLMIIAGK